MASSLGDQLSPLSDVAVAISPPRASVECVKVLHLINGDLYAGAERVQDLLAQRMGEFGYELSFACLKPGRFATDRQCQSAPLVAVPMRFKGDLSPARGVARIIRDGGYRLLHTHSPRAAAVGRFASAWAGVPMVHHLHSPAARETKQFWRNQGNAWVERWSVARAGALVAVSQSVADYARRQRLSGSAGDRITVVHNGVPIQGPLVDRKPPQGAWTLGTAALFRARKGLEVLVEALGILRAQGLNVRLRAVGAFADAQYESEIKSQAARRQLVGAIDWVGYSRDVIGEMRRMDLFVLPSLFGEGLPMVVLEAMSAGVPVIGTHVEGVPEALRDGVDGLIAAPGDPRDLANAITSVVCGDVDWSRLRASAHARQAERFSDRSMAAGVAGVYQSLLDPSSNSTERCTDVDDRR